uniref:Secreted protein n=1 Tax=Angiostrongylus cantonensis TaxID=6313 RepID=A0A0K0DM15_ANGCA
MEINSVLREFIPDVLMITFFLALAFITSAESGCYQRRMCCHGRNISCTYSRGSGLKLHPECTNSNNPASTHNRARLVSKAPVTP